MVQDEGKKEEEKFEFTTEGEVLGYISLDQAGVLAMRSERETPGSYGTRWRDSSMAFEVVGANETDDHYIITLGFRPEGEFKGRPGQEQFFIEKEGTVAVRQVLGLPRPSGISRLPVLPVALGLAAVMAAVVVGIVFATGGLGGNGGGEPAAALVSPTATPPPTPSR